MKLISNNENSNFYNELQRQLKACKSFYFNVAFINFSGVQLLLDILKLCKENRVHGKILSSTYLSFTEPKALKALMEFENLELKIFDTNSLKQGFHPKAYIFEYEDNYNILIGSSNITASAFKTNIEWNLKTIRKKDENFIYELFSEFNNLWDKATFLNTSFLKEYESFYNTIPKKDFVFKKELKANAMQKRALESLTHLRKNKQNKALVIAATGTGKTYLAAFDAKSFKSKRLLFIVHRENILIKAKQSFKKIIPDKSYGLYTGNYKQKNEDFIFTTIQTIATNLNSFSQDEFDYIIIDEVHHISSPSYKRVYDYFKPKFLLGLTATPNRSDGKSIYEYFDENVACDIRLNEALENSLVSPFHYYGINDIEVDLEGVDIDDISSVSKALMINRRVDYIIEKLKFYGFSGKKQKVLGFCASKEHALFMSEEFNKKGVNSITLISSDSIEKREESLKQLEDENSKLQVIFTVDIFNEGLDIPSINTVLMLRPTNSPIVFIQQLGRGLRKSSDKEFLTILDFIGNHKKAFLIALALVSDKKIDKESIKLSLLNNFASFKDVFINMDEISKNRILSQIDEKNFSSMRFLKEQYYKFKELLKGKIPNLEDFVHYDDFISPLDFISEKKSYLEFLLVVEKEHFKNRNFSQSFFKTIRFIESMFPLKRLYEVVILKSLLNKDCLSINDALKSLSSYLAFVRVDTLIHSFKYLNQEFLDSAQCKRYEKLVEFDGETIVKSSEFKNVLKDKFQKNYINEAINYALLEYKKSFGVKDYGYPFLKLYEKYNMLNIAQLCNFPKIHSSFRGSGFLKYEKNFFLFITIEKDKFSKGSKYTNDFLSKELFSFVSKPGHSIAKGDGQKLIRNKEYKVNLHIFVRKFSHVDKKVQNFIYLGLADCVKYWGDKPINTHLKLQKPLSNRLYEEFTKIID